MATVSCGCDDDGGDGNDGDGGGDGGGGGGGGMILMPPCLSVPAPLSLALSPSCFLRFFCSVL